MKRVAIIATLCAVLAPAGLAQLGPSAYLARPAPTKNELLAQVKSNPTVLDRFCRHFQLSKDGVLQMLSGLHKTALTKDTTVEMWGVPAKTGVFRMKKVVLKRGTTVWADSTGNPILRVSCGNPLVRMDEASEPQVAPAVSRAGDVKPVAAPSGTKVEEMLAPAPVEPMLPALPETEWVETPLNTGPISVTELQPSRFDGGGLFALLPSLLIGLRTGGDNKIPEPATIFIVATGASLVLARAKRRSRR
ncbi:MAG: DUF6777 domain-containing protein [Fimbriimonadales bacterium]